MMRVILLSTFAVVMSMVGCSCDKDAANQETTEVEAAAAPENSPLKPECDYTNPFDAGTETQRWKGFEWAREETPMICDGTNEDYIEGCKAYFKETENCEK